MIHDFWLDAMLSDAARRREYQLELLDARRRPCRPHRSIKALLTMVRAARRWRRTRNWWRTLRGFWRSTIWYGLRPRRWRA